ncbi:hypothetical protein U1Q18_012018 [Sarracenia purpurea var. burkii]
MELGDSGLLQREVIGQRRCGRREWRHWWLNASWVASSIRKEEAQRYAGDGDAIADGEPSKMAEDGNVGRRSKG